MTAEKRLERVERLLEKLLAARSFDSQTPLSISDAAACCHVEARWLRERIQRREIPAYRHDDDGNWRVFPRDIQAYLMAESNQAPGRRQRVLRRVA